MKRKVLLVATLALVAIAWLGTGGVVVFDYRTFGGSTSIRTGEGPALTVWVDTHVQETGIPFLFLYCGDRQPYSLQVSAYDHDQQLYRRLLIDEAVIEFDDGEVVRVVSPGDGWTKEFQDYIFYNSSSAGVIRNQSLKVEHLFAGAIRRPADFRLRIKARYVTKAGSMVEAYVDERFRASRQSEVLTNWERIARI